MRNALRLPSLASLLLVFGTTSACGSSDDNSGDVGDSSTPDVGSGDTSHDTAVADSGHDAGGDTGRDTAADGTTDATDSTPSDVGDSGASDSIAVDSIAVDSIAIDSISVDTIVDDSVSVDSIVVDSITVDSITIDSGAPDADVGPGGCTSSADCAPTELCDAPTCSGPGTCVPKPGIGVFCKTDPDMSCGCDGHDYVSACAAHKAGVRVAHYGSCATTGCESTADCASLGAGYYCSFGVGYCTTAGFCKAEGLCPGFLTAYCSCAGDDVSTNTCLADKAGTRLAHTGSCP